MAHPSRTPVLRVRDARTASTRRETEDLRNFLNSGPTVLGPPASISTSSSLSKASATKKSGISFFKSKRKSLEWEEVSYRDVSPQSAKLDDRTTPRKVGSHTVLMINPPRASTSRPFARSISAGFSLNQSPLAPPQVRSTSLANISGSSSRPVLHHVLSEGQIERPPGLAGSTIPLPPNGPPRYSHVMREALIEQFSPPSLPVNAMDHTLDPTAAACSTKTGAAPMIIRNSPPPEARRLPIPRNLLRMESEPVVSIASRRKVTKEAATQTESIEPQEPVTLTSSPHDSSDRLIPVVALPLTPPPSNTALAVDELPNNCIAERKEDRPSSKRRHRKVKEKSGLLIDCHDPGAPLDPVEEDLMRMEDKFEAFNKLWDLYQSQKTLRRAEDNMHQSQMADLEAGFLAERMAHRRIAGFLTQYGISPHDIESIAGASGGLPHQDSASASDDIPDISHLDISRFRLLGKQVRLDQMEEFRSTRHNSPEAQFSGGLKIMSPSLQEIGKKLVQIRPPSPAPTLPLPPIPTRVRSTRSLIISPNMAVASPIVRSKSLTAVQTPTTPFAEAVHLHKNMALLEADCNVSCSYSVTIDCGSSPSRVELPSVAETEETPSIHPSTRNSLIFDADCEDSASSQGSATQDRPSSTEIGNGLGITTLPNAISVKLTRDSHLYSHANGIEETTVLLDDGAVDANPGPIHGNDATTQFDMSTDQETVEDVADSSLDEDRWAAVFHTLVGSSAQREP